MTRLNRRCKTVSIRLSPDEFRLLQDACAAQGARSVSEFARSALYKVITIPSASGAVDEDVRYLQARVQFLSEEVARLADAIQIRGERVCAPGGGNQLLPAVET